MSGRAALLASLTVTVLCGCGREASPKKRPVGPAAAAKAVEGLPGQADGRSAQAPPVETIEVSGSAHSDHQRMQGTWRAVTLAAGSGQNDRIVFSEDNISWHVREQTLAGKFVVDSTKQPKRIDLTFPGEKEGPGVILGIYDFRGDLLVICFGTSGESRPTKLAACEDQILLFFQPSKAEGQSSKTDP